MAFPLISLLKHTRSIYTIEAYRLFEKEFVKGAWYDQCEFYSDKSNREFRISGLTCLEESWGQGLDGCTFEHTIVLNIKKGFIDCTSQNFTKVGLLCSYCL